MSWQSWQTLSNVVTVIGFVALAGGGFGSYYCGKKVSEELRNELHKTLNEVKEAIEKAPKSEYKQERLQEIQERLSKTQKVSTRQRRAVTGR